MQHAVVTIPWPLAPQEPKTAPAGPAPTQPPGGGAPPAPTGTGTQQPAGGGTGPCAMDPSMLLMLGLFMVVMWLMVLGPERKRRKETQQMLAALKAGDRVVTLGGMHGVVSSLGDRTVTVRVDQLKMVFDRSAISRVERDEPAKPDAKKT